MKRKMTKITFNNIKSTRRQRRGIRSAGELNCLAEVGRLDGEAAVEWGKYKTNKK